MLAGIALAAWREFRDRSFRTGDQIRDQLGVRPLGSVPEMWAEDRRGRTAEPALPNGHARMIRKHDGLFNHVVDHPLSAFAETLRNARLAIDLLTGQRRPKRIGVVSVLPGEGKSMIAANLAELLSAQGARVLLIDADLRNPGLTRQIGRFADRGILEALEDSGLTRDLLMFNPDT
eukprot:gene49081-66638_t